jgi:hypothetical protein
MIAKIKFFSDFSKSDQTRKCFESICTYMPAYYYGSSKEIVGTDDDDYTHAIILNRAMPVLKIPKENVIGLAFEPYEFLGFDEKFIDYAKKHISKYYIGDKRNLSEPFVEGIGYMWHANPFKELTYKPNIMSIVLSKKKSAPGHKYRHELVSKIIELGLPIDIYGHGTVKYEKSKSKYIKGPFECVEPYESYMFTIAIENYKNNDYISEKFISPLMHNCKPIYWGANNIFKYVSEKDTILLKKDINQDIELLKKILQEPYSYYSKTFNNKNIKNFNLIFNLPSLLGLNYIKTPIDLS